MKIKSTFVVFRKVPISSGGFCFKEKISRCCLCCSFRILIVHACVRFLNSGRVCNYWPARVCALSGRRACVRVISEQRACVCFLYSGCFGYWSRKRKKRKGEELGSSPYLLLPLANHIRKNLFLLW